MIATITALAWTTSSYRYALSEAKYQANAVADCEKWSEKLLQQRKSSPPTLDVANTVEQSHPAVRKAIASASIPESSLVQVATAQIVPTKSPQLFQQNITIQVNAVQLQQMVQLLTSLENDSKLGICTKLTMVPNAKASSQDDERWNVDLVLTRLTRSAKSPLAST